MLNDISIIIQTINKYCHLNTLALITDNILLWASSINNLGSNN